MKICIFYSSPKLGDLVLQLPFFRAIATHYKTKVSICINQHISIKKILEKQDYIDSVIENPFRRGKFFLIDVFSLVKKLRDINFNYAFIFEKTKGPALACRISGIKKIFGFGIGSQKYLVNKSVKLKKKDLRFNYTKQSIMFLNKLDISFNFSSKFLTLDFKEQNDLLKRYNSLPRPWICLGVDSTEVNRIWPQNNFAQLSDLLIENNMAKTIFIINYENHKNYFSEILLNSKNKDQLVNCKTLNRIEIINLIDLCEYFVGIDSGPSCVAGALNKKTFCIIGPTDATLPRFNSMIKIMSDIYDKSREVGIKRCGDNFVQNDSEVKTISVSKVFDTIVKNL